MIKKSLVGLKDVRSEMWGVSGWENRTLGSVHNLPAGEAGDRQVHNSALWRLVGAISKKSTCVSVLS